MCRDQERCAMVTLLSSLPAFRLDAKSSWNPSATAHWNEQKMFISRYIANFFFTWIQALQPVVNGQIVNELSLAVVLLASSNAGYPCICEGLTPARWEEHRSTDGQITNGFSNTCKGVLNGSIDNIFEEMETTTANNP
jgi:hypothetical protein